MLSTAKEELVVFNLEKICEIMYFVLSTMTHICFIPLQINSQVSIFRYVLCIDMKLTLGSYWPGLNTVKSDDKSTVSVSIKTHSLYFYHLDLKL